MAGTISQSTAKTILTRLGFRVNTSARYYRALADFQGAWALGNSLEIDSVLGPATSAALLKSENRRQDNLGTLSTHFSFHEVACHCDGRYAACRRIAGTGAPGNDRHTLRWAILSLEVLRAKYYPSGLVIVSGYRCDGRNDAVGGATSSQHRWGAAFDIEPKVSTSRVVALDRFSGVGYQGGSNLVRHVDRRDCSGVNPTRGTLNNPTIWRYS